MSLIKRIACFIFAAALFAVIMASSGGYYANDVFPLDKGEKLVKETVIDKTHSKIYTQSNDQYYLKKLVKNDDKWIVEYCEKLAIKPTGLVTDNIKRQGDRELAGELQNQLKSFGIRASALRTVVDYSDTGFLPPVGEQHENSCVGWATGYYLRTYQQAKDYGWAVMGDNGGINPGHVFSPTFIYNLLNDGKNDGIRIDEAGDLLARTGDATLRDFPYVPNDYLTQPSQSVIQSAYPHRIRTWKRLYTDYDTNEYIVQKTKEYLNVGGPVVAGGRVGVNFYWAEPENGITIITADNSNLGGHAYLVVGYDDNLATYDGPGAFKLINSWGTEWGDGGFAYISYKAFASSAIEGYVFTDFLNRVQSTPNVEVNDAVKFSVNFSGTGGRFDIKISDQNDKEIFKQDNLRGEPGLNLFGWNGQDSGGTAVSDGIYKLSIIPYFGSTPKPPVDMTFNKAGKIESASSTAEIIDNVIQYVNVPITFKADGVLNIKIEYDSELYDVITNQEVKAGESKVYTMNNSMFDFNNKDLAKVSIKIDIQ